MQVELDIVSTRRSRAAGVHLHMLSHHTVAGVGFRDNADPGRGQMTAMTGCMYVQFSKTLVA